MKDYYVKHDNVNWCHRHPIKIVINPMLRFIQFWTDKPYVIASITEFKNEKPIFIKFAFFPIKLLKNEKTFR